MFPVKTIYCSGLEEGWSLVADLASFSGSERGGGGGGGLVCGLVRHRGGCMEVNARNKMGENTAKFDKIRLFEGGCGRRRLRQGVVRFYPSLNQRGGSFRQNRH